MISVCHQCRSDHIGPWTTLRYQKRIKPQEPPNRRDRTVSIPPTYKNWSLDREKLAENRIGPTREPRATVLKPHKCERGITAMHRRGLSMHRQNVCITSNASNALFHFKVNDKKTTGKQLVSVSTVMQHLRIIHYQPTAGNPDCLHR